MVERLWSEYICINCANEKIRSVLQQRECDFKKLGTLVSGTTAKKKRRVTKI